MFIKGYWYRYATHVEDLSPPLVPSLSCFGDLWVTKCSTCGTIHGKEWYIEHDLCKSCKEKDNNMHYKNGREAKNGDKVVQVVEGQVAQAGILYDAVAGNDSCNGKIAITTQNDPYANLSQVLHVDDVAKAIIPNSIAN